jgi:hypothetical protein
VSIIYLLSVVEKLNKELTVAVCDATKV